jgi:hypothetical protein
MSAHDDLIARLDRLRPLFREKIGGTGASMERDARKKGHRLPRGMRRRARALARAEPMLAHPKLRLTQDAVQLNRQADVLEDYLNAIDLADRRKGWWLGMLGGMAFNILLVMILLVVVLRWRGLV